MMHKIVACLFVVIVISGCTTQTPSEDKSKNDVEKVKILCIQKCIGVIDAGQDLNNGPCLSNEIAPDWVCDVVHNPRQNVDNDLANQCSAWGKTANHFIEVDTNCNFIRAY